MFSHTFAKVVNVFLMLCILCKQFTLILKLAHTKCTICIHYVIILLIEFLQAFAIFVYILLPYF